MRASDGHHHLSSSNIIQLEALEELFGGGTETSAQNTRDIVGERYKQLLDELTCLAEYQWRSGEPRGLVKGFLLCGPPGTGKTTLAKRFAVELGRRFRSDNDPDIVMAFIDGGEISRSRYGESEERIRDIFMHARTGFNAGGQRSVLLFDDIESIFMARGSTHAKEWHFSQNSVFFHAVDNLDTSRSVIVLTTNRPDLVDEAIRDRFLTYIIDYPDVQTLLEVIERIPALANMPATQIAKLKDDLVTGVKAGTIRSLREAQRFAMREYVANVLRKRSLSELGSSLS